MNKKTLIVSSFIMCFALIVGIVGISAAWFGNTARLSNTITISSGVPKGQVTIDVESAKNSADNGDKLTPAIMKDGWLLGDSGRLDNINVLDNSLVDSDGTDDKKPLKSSAKTSRVNFPFIYVGSSDTGMTDGKKAIIITLTRATLVDPTERDASGNLVNGNAADYLDDFDCLMTIVHVTTDASGNIISTIPNNDIKWTQGKNLINQIEIQMLVIPDVTYNFQGILNFAKVDEECNPALLDTLLYFSFEIAAVQRGAVNL